MATFNTVFGYMKDVSSSVAHERIFTSKVLRPDQDMVMHDLVKKEWSCIGTTERNVLTGMSMPMKFTRNNMAEDGIMLDVTSVAKGVTKVGESELMNTSKYNVSFKSSGIWKLESRKAKLVYSKRDSPNLMDDKVLRSRITAACANLSASEISGTSLTHALERITQAPDMKHIFTKMYLMLMDLTLAATSKSRERSVARKMRDYLDDRVTDGTRLGAAMTHSIVVDVDMMTDDEVEMLGLAAQEYPPVVFCGDNIYNSIVMDADDLRMVTSGVRSTRYALSWVPDSMHRTIVSLACKLDALDDWFYVVKSMRGRPYLMNQVMARTQDTVVSTVLCRSHSHHTSFGMGAKVKHIPKNYPGYLSTSASLIADCMVGEAMHAASTCLVEQIGGYGKVLCRGHPATDSMYQSILREYGVSTMSPDTNALIKVWCDIAETPEFGWALPQGWKEYITALTDEMRCGKDLELPQVMFDCAYVSHENTVWGATRGWKGLGSCTIADTTTDKGDREARIKETAAFLWQMGVRQSRPHMFANTLKKGEDALTGREYTFLRGCEGGYKMTWLRYTLADDVGGRVDATEEEGSGLIDTFFKGTRCSVVYNGGSEWAVKTHRGPELYGVRESMGGGTGVVGADEDVSDSEIVYDDGSGDNGDDIVAPVTYAKKTEPRSEERIFKGLSAVMKRDAGTLKQPKDDFVNGVESGKFTHFEVIPAKGDGSCGLHALANAMEGRKMITAEQHDAVVSELNRRALSDSFHEAEDIARVANEIGLGLRVIDRESAVALEYGCEGDTVTLLRTGNHFDGMRLLDSGGDRILIDHVVSGRASAAESLSNIDAVMSIMPKRMD